MNKKRIFSSDTEGESHKDIEKVLQWTQGDMETISMVQDYSKHIDAQAILTNTEFHDARKKILKIKNRIQDKAVVELGAGVGFAALEMAKYASHVTAIENEPSWSWVFCQHLYRIKPKNLTWIFDDAFEIQRNMCWCPETFDICVVFTRSGIEQMKRCASWMAQEVIMFYQEY